MVTYTHTSTCTHPCLWLGKTAKDRWTWEGFHEYSKRSHVLICLHQVFKNTKISHFRASTAKKMEVQVKHIVQKANASAVTYNKCEEYNLLYLLLLFISCYPPYSSDFIGISEGKR